MKDGGGKGFKATKEAPMVNLTIGDKLDPIWLGISHWSQTRPNLGRY